MRLNELFVGLIEARKNPEQNVKVSAYEAILKYKNDPNTFIHFTNHLDNISKELQTVQFKFGVNPNYQFNTPMGIYGYTLKEFWEQNKMDERKDFTQIGKFAADRPYIIIFKWAGKQKYLHSMGDYNEADWQYDYHKLLELYPGKEGEIEKAIADSNIRGSIGKLWNVTRWLSSHGGKSDNSAIEWNHLFRRLGYAGFNDTGNGAYAQFEYMQAVFFSKDAIRVQDLVYNRSYRDQHNENPRGKSYAIVAHQKKLAGQSILNAHRKITKLLGAELKLGAGWPVLSHDKTYLDNKTISLNNNLLITPKKNEIELKYYPKVLSRFSNTSTEYQDLFKSIKVYSRGIACLPIIKDWINEFDKQLSKQISDDKLVNDFKKHQSRIIKNTVHFGPKKTVTILSSIKVEIIINIEDAVISVNDATNNKSIDSLKFVDISSDYNQAKNQIDSLMTHTIKTINLNAKGN